MLCFSNYVLADSITGSMKNQWNKENQDTRIMKTMGGKILNIVQIVGVAVAVIMLSVLGIKYMFASTNDKATIKEKLMAYVIGAVLLFGASMLIGVIRNFIS